LIIAGSVGRIFGTVIIEKRTHLAVLYATQKQQQLLMLSAAAELRLRVQPRIS